MAGGTPQRSIADARAWIEQLTMRLTVAHHRRILKAALSDIWTAMGQIKSSTTRELRKTDASRARAFRVWWAELLENLPSTHPGLNWVWGVRNTTQHEGEDGAIYDLAIVFDVEHLRAGGSVTVDMVQDAAGNLWVNGQRVDETGPRPGQPWFAHRTALGVNMPAQYGPNDVLHPLRDACDSVERILADVDRLWG